jgi:hypothetical protein
LIYGVRYGTGLTGFEETVMLLSQGLALVAWSWTAGFVLGSLSRRTIWVTGTLYSLAGVYPLFLTLYFLVWAHPWTFDHHPRELPLVLFMLALLFALQIILFLLPSIGRAPRPPKAHFCPASNNRIDGCHRGCHSADNLDWRLAACRSHPLERG